MKPLVTVFLLFAVSWSSMACEKLLRAHKMWLSRQRDGSYMCSFFKPIKMKVAGTSVEDFYLQPGEPIGLRHWCPGGVETLLGVSIPIGESIRVWIGGGVEVKTE